jgi:hypothetical protein
MNRYSAEGSVGPQAAAGWQLTQAGTGHVLKMSTTGAVSTVAQGLSRPAGVAAASDGSCYVSESGRGRVVKLNGGTTAIVEGLQTPQGVALAGDQLLILDTGSKALIGFSLTTKQQQTLASNLPVGAVPGVTPKPLMGVPDLIPGPLSPFAGLAVGNDGKIYIAGDGEGSILALRKG